MCGIVGAIALADGGFAVTEPYVTRMRDTMAHRGPDGGDTWVSPDGHIGLGHRRLAIIDLSECANQPMPNEDGSVVVAFNGEIYNHAEIRAELEALGGHEWRTDHSDTEVIVHAYEQWGIDCVSRFRGMFAIALWDARERALYLVRDRIGIKPLYWSNHHGRIVFGSEIKALLADPDQKRAVDEEALFHYLSFMTTPAPMTLFAGIRKLPCATWMRIDLDGTITEKRWWDAANNAESVVADEAAIEKRLVDELRTAVRYRKVSDVPVGVFLSGGIDSSVNAALFSEDASGPVQTFTIGYQGEHESYANETDFARTMAERVGADHHELLLEPADLTGFLERMVWLQDEPIADPVCVPVYYVSKLARDNGVIVCQVGEGSDELFWGYPWWKTMLRLEHANRWPVPRFLKRAGLGLMRAAGKAESRYYEYLERGAAGRPVFWGGVFAFTETQKRALLSPRLQTRFAGRDSFEVIAPIRERFEAAASRKGLDELAWMTYVDLNLRLPELLLMRVDKMSMGVSLEARVPFLDYRLVEFAMGIPEAVKTRGRVLKAILKSAVRGLIPDELIDRPKQGFGVPLKEWFFDGLGEQMLADIETFATSTDYFDPATARRLAQSDPQLAWYLYNFVLWHRRFIDTEPGPDPAPYAIPGREARS